jgi:hypothetical protein
MTKMARTPTKPGMNTFQPVVASVVEVCLAATALVSFKNQITWSSKADWLQKIRNHKAQKLAVYVANQTDSEKAIDCMASLPLA